MNRHTLVFISSFFMLLLAFFSAAKEKITHGGFAKREKPVYLDPAQPIDTQIENLLSCMTLEDNVRADLCY